jgi:TPR repeat protein
MFGFFNKFNREKKLAENGNPIAQYNVGCCYVNGDGVTQDLAEAVKWFRKVADQRFMQGQYRLGLHYAIGAGVAKDYTEAAKWFRKAADQGCAPAQYGLGECYRNGDGVMKNLVEAYKWFSLASAQGYVDSVLDRPATTDRDVVAQQMTPDQIAEAQKLTREFQLILWGQND